jgi:outer membrane protein OmpA-like peptidoglycan-associated protein/tetratricopeptide (TPR) repeat protein
MRNIIISLIILQSLAFIHPAQCQKIKKPEKEVRYFQYAEAIPKLRKIIEKDKKGKDQAIILLADCYRKINDIPNAAAWYKRAVTLESIDPIVYYHYGQTLRSLGEYEEAGKQFSIYNSLAPDDARGSLFEAQCENIIEYLSLPPSGTVHNMGYLNSENADFSPIIYGYNIIFSTDRELTSHKDTYSWTGAPFISLATAKRVAGDSPEEWVLTDPGLFSDRLDSPYHDGTAVLSMDGNTIYFTRTEKDRKAKKGEDQVLTDNLKIYSSKKENGEWVEAEPFYLNSENYSVGHPALAPGDTLLYFISNMPGGKGGTDLYVCQWNGKEWTGEKNLGTSINTVGDEMFPYLDSEGTLYFSSNGHLGYGGLDIFKSQMADSNWQTPENLLSPINSTYDDFGITLTKENNKGLLSSNRPGGYGNDDMYGFMFNDVIRPIKISGRVVDTDLIPVANATVFLLNTNTDDVLILKSDSLGMYETTVDPNTDYVLLANKAAYLEDCQTFPVKEEDAYPNDLILNKLDVDEVFQVENIYYDLDKWFIRTDAEPPLDNVVKIMKENPISIELSSHTDCRASDAYNKELSQKRAESAVRYIILQGIDPSKITAKGYGETMLVNECADDVECTEEQHQLNRRTEIKVVAVDENVESRDDWLDQYKEGDVYSKNKFDTDFFNDCHAVQE